MNLHKQKAIDGNEAQPVQKMDWRQLMSRLRELKVDETALPALSRGDFRDCVFTITQSGDELRIIGKATTGVDGLRIVYVYHTAARRADFLYETNRNGVASSACRLCEALTLGKTMGTDEVVAQLANFLGQTPQDILRALPRLKNAPDGIYLNFMGTGKLSINVRGEASFLQCIYELDLTSGKRELVYTREKNTVTGAMEVYAKWSRETLGNRPADA